MINLTHPELAEIQTPSLPGASVEALNTIRNRLCNSAGSDYTLQPQQRFLRRVLSPDSPTQNLLMVHGTGVGKTCTGIQIAEEYIMRPEFQDKKVLVVASSAVQQNFRTQIFDMSRVDLDKVSGTLTSKQCTGRRYLDMLLRIESEPNRWDDPDVRSKLETTSDRIIKEFYEFQAYISFGNRLNEKLEGTEADIDRDWVHENFDNRLVIIDEAQNITTEATGVARGLEKLVKIANGMVLVLLTATPMYDTFEEIVFFMNLFLWNARKQDFGTSIKTSDLFTPEADLKKGEPEKKFREWCQEYVSYVKGESPFTFPFRLPPPVIADPNALIMGFNNNEIPDDHRIKYLSLVASQPAGKQLEVLTASRGGEDETDDARRAAMMVPTLSVFPGNKEFKDVFEGKANKLKYRKDVEPFLAPENLPGYSSKFVSVIKSIDSSSGVCLVYSNYVKRGAQLFAIALEEHGYTAYDRSKNQLEKSSYKGPAKGKYALISSEASEYEISTMLAKIKRKDNATGTNVKIVITSPLAAEGIDFRFIRQVHILDPWWNMSRIEQVIGRALRTCSHQALPTKEQNCTVYLHVVRLGGDREAFDEYTYRTKVETKGIRIAKVRKVMAESAMDCPVQVALPADWRELEVPQTRDEGSEGLNLRLKTMMAPAFDEAPDVEQCKVTPSVPDPDHVRPLSSYLDSRDEILTKVGKLFVDKSIWDREQLFSAMRPFSRDVVVYTLQQAISTAFRFVDAFGRQSLLESKGDLYALAPIGTSNSTLVERTTKPIKPDDLELPEAPVEEAGPPPDVSVDLLDTKREAYKWVKGVRERFSDEVLNGYIFDHDFSPAEKSVFLATRPDLPFADRLYVPDSDIVVTGADLDLVGEELTKYQAWRDALIDRFVADKGSLFASVAKGGILTLSPSTSAEGVLTRSLAAKTFMPIVCGTGSNNMEHMKSVAKFIDTTGAGYSAQLKGQGNVCQYVELLAREEHNIKWYTPEELKVLESLSGELKNKVKKGLKA